MRNPSPNTAFNTPTELIEYISQMRVLSGGKPAGFKLCVGSRVDALVEIGLRDRIRSGASDEVAAGNDIVNRLVEGADYTNSVQAMLTAVG